MDKYGKWPWRTFCTCVYRKFSSIHLNNNSFFALTFHHNRTHTHAHLDNYDDKSKNYLIGFCLYTHSTNHLILEDDTSFWSPCCLIWLHFHHFGFSVLSLQKPILHSLFEIWTQNQPRKEFHSRFTMKKFSLEMAGVCMCALFIASWDFGRSFLQMEKSIFGIGF